MGEVVRFDENGDPIASYDLMNWQEANDGSLQLVKVGFYDASLREERDLVINESVIMWHRGNKVCSIASIARLFFIRLFLIELFCMCVPQLESIMFCSFQWRYTVCSVDFTLGL